MSHSCSVLLSDDSLSNRNWTRCVDNKSKLSYILGSFSPDIFTHELGNGYFHSFKFGQFMYNRAIEFGKSKYKSSDVDHVSFAKGFLSHLTQDHAAHHYSSFLLPVNDQNLELAADAFEYATFQPSAISVPNYPEGLSTFLSDCTNAFHHSWNWWDGSVPDYDQETIQNAADAFLNMILKETAGLLVEIPIMFNSMQIYGTCQRDNQLDAKNDFLRARKFSISWTGLAIDQIQKNLCQIQDLACLNNEMIKLYDTDFYEKGNTICL
ncbi:hypothetical protein M0812_03890 [Anaeramoeba flamelloides]|uniref:Phospholipase C/D domain-containing protein n=1 Tax=Anaeramoeba flamelloides TaxID=1746091 RepID=A0AAV8AGN3_9EUKA|nr:hypothetical protein M0812_03890 [Anaeramoeba flamelloides]